MVGHAVQHKWFYITYSYVYNKCTCEKNSFIFQENIKQIAMDECKESVHHLINKEIDKSGSSQVLENLFQRYNSNFLAKEFQSVYNIYCGK